MNLCLFEDPLARNFLPLSFFRPVYDLRCGMLSLRERAVRMLQPASLTLFAREYLAGVLREENPKAEVNTITGSASLFLNGRTLMDSSLARQLKKPAGDALFTSGNEVVAAYLSGENLLKARSSRVPDAIDLSDLQGLPRVEVETKLVWYPWDLVYANEEVMEADFRLLTKGGKGIARGAAVHPRAMLVEKGRIHVGRKSVVGPGVVLDASGGPIYIGENVHIFPLAAIEGPCCVGDGSMIKIGAKIYANTSIGPVCKVGGEVEHSTFHSHANKQHDGFLGHAYICPWVNLGAGTTNSNLKNTYGSVRVNVSGRIVDTGKMFVGLSAGDHVKIGINGTIDTGTVIGPSSNIFGATIPPKYIPPFTWGTAGNFAEYDLTRALAVATTVMGRRNVAVTESYRQVFRHVYEMTNRERTGYIG